MCNWTTDRSQKISPSASKYACEVRLKHYAKVVIDAPCEKKFDVMHQQGMSISADNEAVQSFFTCNLGPKFVALNGASQNWSRAGIPVADAVHGMAAFIAETHTQTPSCDAVVANFQDKPANVRRAAAPYFVSMKCSAAASLYEDMLIDNSADRRQTACVTLGEIGTRASLSRLNIVAESDAAFEVVDLNKVYYVRDACRAAAGKIKLRGEPRRVATR